jgi:hypothetical protein
MPHNFLKDDKGNDSSFRVGFAISFIVSLYMIVFFTMFMLKELSKEEVNYEGLVLFGSTLVLQIIGTLIAKSQSKKYERD